jgi:hypothetical protein
MLKVKTSEKVLPTVEAVKVSPKCALKPPTPSPAVASGTLRSIACAAAPWEAAAAPAMRALRTRDFSFMIVPEISYRDLLSGEPAY